MTTPATPSPALPKPKLVLFKGNLRGCGPSAVPTGQSVPDTCPECGAWREQLAAGLRCTEPTCSMRGRVMMSEIEGYVAIQPLLTQKAEVGNELAILEKRQKRDKWLSFEDEQELRDLQAQVVSLTTTIKWLRTHPQPHAVR